MRLVARWHVSARGTLEPFAASHVRPRNAVRRAVQVSHWCVVTTLRAANDHQVFHGSAFGVAAAFTRRRARSNYQKHLNLARSVVQVFPLAH